MKEGWENKILQDVCDLDKSQGIHKNLPYIGMEDIESNTGRFIGSTEPQAVKSSTFKFTTNHVLYGRLRPYLNKVLVPDFEGHCSTEIFPIRPTTQLSKEFLQYWFLMDSTVRLINSTCTGARMPRANMKEVMQFQFPSPPILEQKRIVAILDEVFAGIAQAVAHAEKNLANSHELFEGYLNSIFTQKGEGWLDETIEHLCIIGDGNHSSKYPKKSEMVASGVPFIRGTNLIDGKISANDILYISEQKHQDLKKGHLKTGDVLFTNRGEIGKVAIVDEAFDGANLNSQIAWLRSRDTLIPEYLFFFLQSGLMRSHFSQTKSGAALQQFTIKMIKEVVISYPRISIQEKIVSQLADLSFEVNRLESIYQHKLTVLTELKQSILQKAFAGELTAESAELKALA